MQIFTNNYSISELILMLNRKELIINDKYQRGAGLWPLGPSSYFIDTILEGFPFPKIYLYEFFTREERKTRREIVDGQQRIKTIENFINNKFRVIGDSKYAGMYFDDLDPETQENFLTYSVSVDVIRTATRAEILQMFRRMNAYTLPLNEAEKRHSSFSGDFKFFINELSDDLNEFFVQFGVFTDREILRMKDAEFIAELILALENGIISLSPTQLNAIYRKYDNSFPCREEYFSMITQAFQFIYTELEPLRKTFMMKSYALHSLVIALITARFGNIEIERQLDIRSIGSFAVDNALARDRLLELARAHEGKEIDGPLNKYVRATSSSTTKAPNRTIRTAIILEALGVVTGNQNYDRTF